MREPLEFLWLHVDTEDVGVSSSLVLSEGIRLLSPRPSVAAKLETLAEKASGAEVAPDGLRLTGLGWTSHLKELLGQLAQSERAGVFAIPLGGEDPLPVLAEVILARAKYDWFPEFLSHGRLVPHFQVVVDLQTGQPFGREALIRGKLGKTEVRGGELVAAAEAFDSVFSFDTRARAAAFEVGLPLMPPGEMLMVNCDTRALREVATSVRSTWSVIDRLGVAESSIGLELVRPELSLDRDLVVDFAHAHRERGAYITVDDLSGGVESLELLELLKPDMVKIDTVLTARMEASPARQRLVSALIEVAHELGCKVGAKGIERIQEFQALKELGADYGQGYYFGAPMERPMPLDSRLVETVGS